MRFSGPVLALVMLAASTAGCGWSPPAAPPTSTVDCGPGPSPDAVAFELQLLPPGSWRATPRRGGSPDCQLYWVVVSAGDASDSPQQVLFFDGVNPIGSPTPDPRPYITVTPSGRSHRECAVPVAPGPGPCLLSPPVSGRPGSTIEGRQAHGAGPDTWPLKCCAVVGNRLSRSQISGSRAYAEGTSAGSALTPRSAESGCLDTNS